MVLYADVTFDSRVQREANALVAAGHDVTIFCLEGAQEAAPMLDRRVALAGAPKRRAVMVGRPGQSVRHGVRAGPPPGARGDSSRRIARNLRTWGREVARQQRGV